LTPPQSHLPAERGRRCVVSTTEKPIRKYLREDHRSQPAGLYALNSTLCNTTVNYPALADGFPLYCPASPNGGGLHRL